MAYQVKLVINNSAMNALLRGPSGPVYIDMMRRADNLQRAAKGQVPVGRTAPRTPRGHLRDSIVKRLFPTSAGNTYVEVWVGSDHPNALLVHEGTGPHIIEPSKASVLHFVADGGEVFAAYVMHPGTPANHYLTDNLPVVTQ